MYTGNNVIVLPWNGLLLIIHQEDKYLKNELVIVIDFGGQYNQLVARRVRECNVYCEIYSYKIDIEKIKEEYGDKLCLIGNVDLNYLLPFGSPEEVEKEVKKLAEIAGPEGFILSTCNILTDAVPVENAKAMYYFDKE